MCRLWIVALLALFASVSSWAAEPMSVRLIQQSQGDWISAEGEITADTPAQFRKVLAALGKRKLPVVITSPGGRISAALSIGRMIRRQGLSVTAQGTCASACPFVLAGGVERFSGDGAIVGVHQALMLRPGAADAQAASSASRGDLLGNSKATARQFALMRAKLRAYLGEMGVSTAIVEEMNKASPFEMNVLSLARQKELRLVTAETTDLTVLSSNVIEPAAADYTYTSAFEPTP